jgi:hypothetical protein
LLMRNMTTPLRSDPVRVGKPTVRKAQVLSGRTMTQEANAGASKGDRKPVAARLAPPLVAAG